MLNFFVNVSQGLVPAIQGLSAHEEQRLCVKHLYGKWKNKHTGLDLKQTMWAAARATSILVWTRSMEKLKLQKEEAWKDMNEIPAKFWTRAYFKTYSKCDIQVNNMCEAYNREILEYRDKPIITLLEGIKHYITKRIKNKRHCCKDIQERYVPEYKCCLRRTKKKHNNGLQLGMVMMISQFLE